MSQRHFSLSPVRSEQVTGHVWRHVCLYCSTLAAGHTHDCTIRTVSCLPIRKKKERSSVKRSVTTRGGFIYTVLHTPVRNDATCKNHCHVHTWITDIATVRVYFHRPTILSVCQNFPGRFLFQFTYYPIMTSSFDIETRFFTTNVTFYTINVLKLCRQPYHLTTDVFI